MSKLIVLCGVPGSGKSYFTTGLKKIRAKHVYTVSSDALREIIGGSPTYFDEEELMWSMYYKLADVYSSDKEAITILDSMNLIKQYRMGNVIELSKKYDQVYLVVFKIDKDLVITQNLEREHPVPLDAMKVLFDTFEPVDKEEKDFFTKVLYIKEKTDFASVINEILIN